MYNVSPISNFFNALFSYRLTLSAIILLIISGCGAPEGGSENGQSSSSDDMSMPRVNVTEDNNRITLQWNDTNAAQYRVLYWHDDEDPQEYLTTDTTYITPSLISERYTFLVEAYDDLGNSRFSEPTLVEVN